MSLAYGWLPYLWDKFIVTGSVEKKDTCPKCGHKKVHLTKIRGASCERQLAAEKCGQKRYPLQARAQNFRIKKNLRCANCSPQVCVSTPKMIFSLRREVKSSDFMRVSVMLPFSFSRTFQKRCGKLCGPFRGEEREDSKPLPHPVLRRHIALHIVFRGIRLGVLGEEEILQRLDAPVHGGSNSLHTLLVDEFLGAGECLPDILVNAVQLGEVQPVKRGHQPQRVSALR